MEGAPCAAAGSADDCPGGQACGNDLRCSARALSCAASRCAPGAGGECAGAIAVRCSELDPVCGRWVREDCGARALECGTRSGSAACECPEYAGTTVAADPGGSPSRDAYPYPRGQASPRECRFARLGDALDAAAARAPAPASVIVHAAPGQAAVFGAATGESWPLAVAANVTLAGAAAPAGPSVIRGEPGDAPLVSVQGALQGVRVEGAPAPDVGIRGTGVETSCGGEAVPSLRDVDVDGGIALDPAGVPTAGLAAGVSVTGACGATLVAVDVARVAGPALALDPVGAATVTVLGGSYGSSTVGITITGNGKVTLAPDPETAASVVVEGNAKEGILISGAATQVDATLDRVVVSANGGTGVVVYVVSSASRMSMRRCDIAANGIAAARFYGPVGAQRIVGGMLVAQPSLSDLVFLGNRVFANAGDQLVFFSDSYWKISAPSCGPDSNVFQCTRDGTFAGVQAGAFAVGVTSPGTVDAAHNIWPREPVSEWLADGVLQPDPFDYCSPAIAYIPPLPPIPACP